MRLLVEAERFRYVLVRFKQSGKCIDTDDASASYFTLNFPSDSFNPDLFKWTRIGTLIIKS